MSDYMELSYRKGTLTDEEAFKKLKASFDEAMVAHFTEGLHVLKVFVRKQEHKCLDKELREVVYIVTLTFVINDLEDYELHYRVPNTGVHELIKGGDYVGT